jgi:hypothetical protein
MGRQGFGYVDRIRPGRLHRGYGIGVWSQPGASVAITWNQTTSIN